MILQQAQRNTIGAMPVAKTPLMSVNETVADLKARGYKYKFRREANCLYCIDFGSWFMPDGFKVDEYHHFEDNSNTRGDIMLYAISSMEGLKGFLVDTYFVYADSELEYELAEEY